MTRYLARVIAEASLWTLRRTMHYGFEKRYPGVRMSVRIVNVTKGSA